MDPAQGTKNTCMWHELYYDEELKGMAEELVEHHRAARAIIPGILLNLVKRSREDQKAFFYSCKALDLRDWKLWSAYIFSARRCSVLVNNVLNGNARMVEYVEHKEKEYREFPPKYAP